MKKIVLVFLVGLAHLVNAQCTIEGNSQVKVNDKAIYQISKEYAQCENCHQWKVLGNASIEGDVRKNKIVVSSNNQGSVTLNLMMLTPNGMEQCSKNINFVTNGTNHPYSAEVNYQESNRRKPKVDCDIKAKTFKEVGYEDKKVAFFPNVQGDDYVYSWEVYYINNPIPKTSEEKVAVFSYDATNYILKVDLTITSKRCMKKLSKVYNESFWKYFGN